MSGVFSDMSVVVPAYNPGPQILDCLSSLFAIDYPMGQLEVIVVDDCSSEDIGGIVREHFPLVKLIRRSQNGGCDAARQDGISAASGSIIAHTDADCCVSRDWARRINKHLQTGASAVTGLVLHQREFLAQFIALTQFGHFQSKRAGTCPTFPGCNFATTRSVLDEFGYVNRGLRDGADRLLSWRIAQAGGVIAYDPEMIVHHNPVLSPRSLWRRWLYYSQVTYNVRKADRSLPGGCLLRLGPAAPGFLALARLSRDYQRLLAFLLERKAPLCWLAIYAAGLPLMRTVDACAMTAACVRKNGREQ